MPLRLHTEYYTTASSIALWMTAPLQSFSSPHVTLTRIIKNRSSLKLNALWKKELRRQRMQQDRVFPKSGAVITGPLRAEAKWRFLLCTYPSQDKSGSKCRTPFQLSPAPRPSSCTSQPTSMDTQERLTDGWRRNKGRVPDQENTVHRGIDIYEFSQHWLRPALGNHSREMPF